MKPVLLIVDDEESVRESFRLALQDHYQLAFAEDAKSTLRLLKNQTFDLCLLDIMLPDGSGLDLLRQVKRRDETIDVIMVTALTGVDTALEAMKGGAYDYITKPYKIDELYELIRRVLAKRALERENRYLRLEMDLRKPVSLMGESKALRETLKNIETLSKTDLPIFLTGEMGIGLEEAAREIHYHSARQKGPFVVVPCVSLPKNQTERELFGEEGDEARSKPPQIGKVEFADKGTLYLEQVDRLPLEAQEHLMGVLKDKKMKRPGGQAFLPLDVRVIGSSDSDLESKVDKGTFRKDLYQYLKASTLILHPLRERREDIPELIEHFLKIANQKAKVPVKTMQKDALQFLAQYSWPGNISELENSLETMVLFAGKDTLTIEDIPLDILVKQIDLARTKEEAKLSLKRVRRQFERQYIRKVLERTRGNQTRAAATLGLHRNTLIWKLKELNLEEDYKSIVKKRREHGVGFRDLK
ncbi:MAG TPA: sigma-54 dependent transcriptional regulator [bacterium]|nr:sigma-54 dependent transcriptional regulator [bacterium]